MEGDTKLRSFKYFVYKFYHENENKTVFTWTKYQDFMNIASVD